jgi:hypothetical protein
MPDSSAMTLGIIQLKKLWEKLWVKWPLCILAFLALVDAFSFVMDHVSNGRQPISAAKAECGEPVGEVCFDVIDGFVVERSAQEHVKRGTK